MVKYMFIFDRRCLWRRRSSLALLLTTGEREAEKIKKLEIFMFLFPSQVYFSLDGSKLYALGNTNDANGAFVAVLCMKTGNVLQKIKPSKDNIYRFCIDVSCTKCIVGKFVA